MLIRAGDAVLGTHRQNSCAPVHFGATTLM
jgi:hypothetical protein